jgi:hypothetical protein
MVVQNAERVEGLVAVRPESVPLRILRGLLLYNKARHGASQGFWRGAWHTASAAVDVFAKLHEELPDDADVASLLKEAEHRKWLYDD